MDGDKRPKPEAKCSHPPGTPPEARSEQRHRTVMLTAKLIDPAGERLCMLKDISPSGMRIRLFGAQPIPRQSLFEFSEGGRVSASMKWQDGRLAGFEFDQALDVERLLHGPARGYRRRTPRLACDRTVRISTEDELFRARMTDISLRGVGLESDDFGDLGKRVSVELPRLGQKSGVICWSRHGRLGITFDTPFAPRDLDDWLAREALDTIPEGHATG